MQPTPEERLKQYTWQRVQEQLNETRSIYKDSLKLFLNILQANDFNLQPAIIEYLRIIKIEPEDYFREYERKLIEHPDWLQFFE